MKQVLYGAVFLFTLVILLGGCERKTTQTATASEANTGTEIKKAQKIATGVWHACSVLSDGRPQFLLVGSQMLWKLQQEGPLPAPYYPMAI